MVFPLVSFNGSPLLVIRLVRYPVPIAAMGSVEGIAFDSAELRAQ